MLNIVAATVMIISFDGGGYVHEYRAKAEDIIHHQTQVRIVGSCFSACTIMADLARNQVCVGPKARFHFHQGTYQSTGERFHVQYTPDVDLLVGEQPTEGWKTLTFDDLITIWRPCS